MKKVDRLLVDFENLSREEQESFINSLLRRLGTGLSFRFDSEEMTCNEELDRFLWLDFLENWVYSFGKTHQTARSIVDHETLMRPLRSIFRKPVFTLEDVEQSLEYLALGKEKHGYSISRGFHPLSRSVLYSVRPIKK
jgi:hypothetical protein